MRAVLPYFPAENLHAPLRAPAAVSSGGNAVDDMASMLHPRFDRRAAARVFAVCSSVEGVHATKRASAARRRRNGPI